MNKVFSDGEFGLEMNSAGAYWLCPSLSESIAKSVLIWLEKNFTQKLTGEDSPCN